MINLFIFININNQNLNFLQLIFAKAYFQNFLLNIFVKFLIILFLYEQKDILLAFIKKFLKIICKLQLQIQCKIENQKAFQKYIFPNLNISKINILKEKNFLNKQISLKNNKIPRITKNYSHNLSQNPFQYNTQSYNKNLSTLKSQSHTFHQIMYAQTLQALSSKLQNANKITLQQKRRQKQQAQLKLLSIETFLNQKKKYQTQQLDSCKENINSLAKLCEETIKNFAIKTEKEHELVNVLKQEMQTEIEKEQKQYHNNIQTILEQSEKNIQTYIQQSQKKVKTQRDKGDHLLNQLSKRLVLLQKDFKGQCQIRKQNCSKITSEIQEEILRFRGQIDKEKEKRKVSQKKMNSMVMEIQEKIKSEIKVQTEKRKKNNAALLKLIQVACNKLEDVMQG